MPKKIDWEEIKKAYLEGAESYASLAMRFGVGKSTIEARASTEGWAALKKQGKAPVPPQKSQIRTRAIQGDTLDEVEIIEGAISSLSAILVGGIEDTRGIGSIAGGLCKLIELRNKLVPKTAADLADMAIELNISPKDFIRALSDKWQERA